MEGGFPYPVLRASFLPQFPPEIKLSPPGYLEGNLISQFSLPPVSPGQWPPDLEPILLKPSNS